MEIFVGCSSSETVDQKYLNVAKELGTLIAKNNHTLIFGSSDKGMMGELYYAVKNNGGKVTAIIPKEYRGMLTDVAADRVIETSTASDQLQALVNMGNMTIILPGSYGALSELTTSIQCRKLGENGKEIFIVNSFGFYDELLKLFDKYFIEKFDLYDKNKLYKVVDTPHEIFK